ncbi:hypothetical protein ABKV25_21985, partial [Enterobacter asburiae]
GDIMLDALIGAVFAIVSYSSLAAVIGLGTILGKMMEVSGAAERIGIALQRCRWLSADVIMVLVGLICGITLFVEVGVVLLIPLALCTYVCPGK